MLNTRLVRWSLTVAIFLSLKFYHVALAQTVAPPNDTVAMIQAIAANSGTPAQICAAITPILEANPSTASTLIESAQSQPQLLEPLCQCLSETQSALKGTNPEAAAVIAKVVASASPAFQACYAVAQTAPAGNPAQAAAPAPTAAPTGGAPAGTPFAFSPASNFTAPGGGPVSSPLVSPN